MGFKKLLGIGACLAALVTVLAKDVAKDYDISVPKEKQTTQKQTDEENKQLLKLPELKNASDPNAEYLPDSESMKHAGVLEKNIQEPDYIGPSKGKGRGGIIVGADAAGSDVVGGIELPELKSEKEFDDEKTSDENINSIFKIYSIHSSNTALEKAKVVLLGETHSKHIGEICVFLTEHAKEGDVLLSEGSQKGEETLPLTSLEIVIKKDLHVYGADDMKLTKECAKYIVAFSDLYSSVKDKPKKLMIQSPTLYLLLDKINGLQKKRENIFYEVISTLSKKYKDAVIYVRIGSLHVKNDSIISRLKKDGIKYCALIPKNDKNSVEDAKKHIEKLKESLYKESNK